MGLLDRLPEMVGDSFICNCFGVKIEGLNVAMAWPLDVWRGSRALTSVADIYSTHKLRTRVRSVSCMCSMYVRICSIKGHKGESLDSGEEHCSVLVYIICMYLIKAEMCCAVLCACRCFVCACTVSRRLLLLAINA